MGSRISKPIENTQEFAGRNCVHRSCHTIKMPIYLADSSVQTDPVKICAVASLVEKVSQTEIVSIRPPVRQEIYDYNDGIDDTSVFSDITSLPGDVSIYGAMPLINRVKATNGPFGMSPDSAFFSSNIYFEDSLHNKTVSDSGTEVPVPNKRHRHVREPTEPLPNLDAANFECCLWVPTEEVGRIFATSKDRRMESIARTCNCRFLLTDTHRVTKNLGVQLLVYILSNTRSDLEKCRGMLDEKFPTFYVKASEIVSRHPAIPT